MKIGIDLIKLSAQGSHVGWNAFLTKCLNNMDINSLARVRRELQIGMDDLVKQKLNTEKMITLYLRLNSSLEKTARSILRVKFPKPIVDCVEAENKWKEVKALRYNELQKFLKKEAY